MSNDKFFSKANIYPALWAIIVALLAFTVGLFWKTLSGPEEVIVIKKHNEKDTSVNIIQFKPDQEYFEKLSNLTAKTVKSQYSNNKATEKKKDIDSLAVNIAKEYQLKFDSLRLTLPASSPHFVNDLIESYPTSANTAKNVSEIKRPRFSVPVTVEGYTESKINSYASITLNKTEFRRREIVTVNIEFLRISTLDRITPIFVDLVQSTGTNSDYQIWSEQYEINGLRNSISFSADFKPGKYTLIIGFYLKNELDTKYPLFYSKNYNIEII